MNVNFGLFPPLAQIADQEARRHAAARHREDRRQEAARSAPARWPISIAGSAARASRPNRLRTACASRLRAARHSTHCRRHCGSSAGPNGSIAAPLHPLERRPHQRQRQQAPAQPRPALSSSRPRARAEMLPRPQPQLRQHGAQFGRGLAGEHIVPAARRSAASDRPADRAAAARHAPAARAAARRSHRRCRHGRRARRCPDRGRRRGCAPQARSAPTRSRRIALELGQRRHRIVVEIERCAHRSARRAPAAAAGSARRRRAAPPRPDCASTSPRPAPPSTSRHHCSRISPGIGSRASSRTRAISRLKA